MPDRSRFRRLCTGVAVSLALALPAPAAIAASVDPQGVLDEARDALQKRDRDRLLDVVPLLRNAAQTRREVKPSPELLLVWGRVERLVASRDSALVAFSAYEGTGEHPGLGTLELARTRFILGERNAVGDYLAGARVGDSATVAAYRADLLLVTTAAELKAWDKLETGDARAAWLATFWSERDEDAMRDPGERIVEHYRRLEYARATFPLPPDRKRHYLPGAAFRSPVSDFDDRGVIYVRHGHPTRVVTSYRDGPDLMAARGGASMPAMETWKYDRPDGDLILNFRACATMSPNGGLQYSAGVCTDPLDFQLVSSVLDVFGMSLGGKVEGGTASIRGNDPIKFSQVEILLLARRSLSPRFGDLLGTDRYTLPVAAAREREESTRDFEIGVGTDSYGFTYDRPIDGRVETLVAGRVDDRALIHVVYAVNAKSTAPFKMDGTWVYPLRLRVRVTDKKGRVVARLDHQRNFRSARKLGDHETILGRAEVAVPPGELAYHAVLEQDEERGTALPKQAVVVPEIIAGRLAMSDVILGHGAIPLVWVRAPDDTVRFNPSGMYTAAATLQVYHEVYGVPPGEAFHVTMTVTGDRNSPDRPPGGDRAAIAVGADETSRGLLTAVHRELDISQLAPGAYELEVAVSRPGGKSIVKKRRFEVRKADPSLP